MCELLAHYKMIPLCAQQLMLNKSCINKSTFFILVLQKITNRYKILILLNNKEVELIKNWSLQSQILKASVILIFPIYY